MRKLLLIGTVSGSLFLSGMEKNNNGVPAQAIAPRLFSVCTLPPSLSWIDEEKNTLLHKAANEENEKTMRMLLLQGAPVNAQNNDGTTPLMVAVEGGSLAMVNLLLQARAYPGIQDKDGDDALEIAIRCLVTSLEKYNTKKNPQDIVQACRFYRIFTSLIRANNTHAWAGGNDAALEYLMVLKKDAEAHKKNRLVTSYQSVIEWVKKSSLKKE